MLNRMVAVLAPLNVALGATLVATFILGWANGIMPERLATTVTLIVGGILANTCLLAALLTARRRQASVSA